MTRKKLLRRPFFAIIVIALLLFAGWCYWAWRDLNSPRTHGSADHLVTLPPGATMNSVISALHLEGIIAHELPAKLWVIGFARGRSPKAGDYQFKSPISAIGALEKVLRGEVATRHLTIPEGFNQFDIARALSALTSVKSDKENSSDTVGLSLLLMKDVSSIKGIDPSAASLEGYLFPDTYDYTSSTTRRQLVDAMVRRFRQIWNADRQRRAKELGMSVRQVITLASLIEKEAKVDSERELISSVFHRRLKIGMPLACDPTVIYAALLEGKYRGKIYQSDLDRNSAYNTYKRVGLPPGPIASPGKRSIDAALNPAKTDYLYFVVDASATNGAHKFSATSADHDRAVSALRDAERREMR